MILRSFSIYFSLTGAKNFVRLTDPFVIIRVCFFEVPLNKIKDTFWVTGKLARGFYPVTILMPLPTRTSITWDPESPLSSFSLILDFHAIAYF